MCVYESAYCTLQLHFPVRSAQAHTFLSMSQVWVSDPGRLHSHCVHCGKDEWSFCYPQYFRLRAKSVSVLCCVSEYQRFSTLHPSSVNNNVGCNIIPVVLLLSLLPVGSPCIQFDIHCISLLWRSHDRSSSLCWRYTAGSLSRSRCNHIPMHTYKGSWIKPTSTRQ